MKGKLFRYEAKQERIEMSEELFDSYEKTMDSEHEFNHKQQRGEGRTPVTNVTGEVVRRTDAAICLQLDKGNIRNDVHEGQIWVPLSLIPKLKISADKQLIECKIETWFLRSKGYLITG